MQSRTRLAPSPTGSLHLGNAFAFLINWAYARKQDMEILLRIEDIDGPRKKPDASKECIEVLQWLGLDWDGEIHHQSSGFVRMNNELQKLIQTSSAYHCTLTRKEIEQSLSAPHATESRQKPCYRPSDIPKHNCDIPTGNHNWRFVSQQDKVTINDRLHGEVQFENDTDFVIWTKENIPSYQFAVVCDDHFQQITDVVRGNDLLQSASWQEQIYESLGWEKPNWIHLPLITGSDGKRLAKRHGDTRIASLIGANVKKERIIGLISTWAGVTNKLKECSLQDFMDGFTLQRIPNSNIIFSDEEQSWLLK